MGQIFPTLTAVISAVAVYATSSPSNHPDINSAHENAFAIFNSIHSAMRQWGSSVHHNGLSFYLATAPEGSLFYHGGFSPDRPDSFEWLAFEVEHAAQFSASWEWTEDPRDQTRSESTTFSDTALKALLRHRSSHARPPSATTHGSSPHDRAFSQRPMAIEDNEDNDDNDKNPFLPPGFPPFDQLLRGYFHVYRATRPLNLLYIDGQAAAKGPLGAQDSQDLILLGHQDPGPGPPTFGEMRRAGSLCALADEWKHPDGAKIDGFIRMEAGFEIIYCDFSERGGLDQVSVRSSSFSNETGLEPRQLGPLFEWLRASAARFHGHPAGRVDIDWSSMVSAYSYPLNVSNPDWHRQDLPRLVNATMQGRLGVRDRLRDVFAARGGGQAVSGRKVVNWQGVVDSVVTRYSERLGYIVDNSQWSRNGLLLAVGTMVDPYISYTDHSPASEQRAVDRCTQHYLGPSLLRPETWTPEDHAIATAVERVSRDICESLFLARRALRVDDRQGVDSGAVVEEAQQTVVELTERLRWSTWRECGKCESPDELCSIPMFPMGVSEEDYFHPSCKNITALMQDFGYWIREVDVDI